MRYALPSARFRELARPIAARNHRVPPEQVERALDLAERIAGIKGPLDAFEILGRRSPRQLALIDSSLHAMRDAEAAGQYRPITMAPLTDRFSPVNETNFLERATRIAEANPLIRPSQRSEAVRRAKSIALLTNAREALEDLESKSYTGIAHKEARLRRNTDGRARSQSVERGTNGEESASEGPRNAEIAERLAREQEERILEAAARRAANAFDTASPRTARDFMAHQALSALLAAVANALPQYAGEEKMTVKKMLLYFLEREASGNLNRARLMQLLRETVDAWGVNDLTLRLNALNNHSALPIDESDAPEKEAPTRKRKGKKAASFGGERAFEKRLFLSKCLKLSTPDIEELYANNRRICRRVCDKIYSLIRTAPDRQRAQKHAAILQLRFGDEQRVHSMEEIARLKQVSTHAARREMDEAVFLFADLARRFNARADGFEPCIPKIDVEACMQIISKAIVSGDLSTLKELPIAKPSELSVEQMIKALVGISTKSDADKQRIQEALVQLERSGDIEDLRPAMTREYRVLQLRYLETERVRDYSLVAEILREEERAEKPLCPEAIRQAEKRGLNALAQFISKPLEA